MLISALAILFYEWIKYYVFIARKKKRSRESEQLKLWVISLAKYSNITDNISQIICESSAALNDKKMREELLIVSNQLNYGEYPMKAFERMVEKYDYQVVREIVAHINTTYHYSGDYQKLFRAIESDYLLESNATYRLAMAKKMDILFQRVLFIGFPLVFSLFLITSKSIMDYYIFSGDFFWLSIVIIIYSTILHKFISDNSEDIYD